MNNINLDMNFQYMISNFTKYYNFSFPKRGLSFSLINSYCEIEGKFGGKTYCFLVNTLQAMILLFFNQAEYKNEASLKILIDKIALKEDELIVCLLPLVYYY